MERERLTITLRRDILERIDKTIDGDAIRNRSHAIEYLLKKAFPPSVKKAIILAGGPGVKMRPLTYELPKAMIPLHGRPILEYTIKLLRKNEIADITICVGALGEKIISYFGDGSNFGVKITYIREHKRLGTGGALANIKDIIATEPVMVIYGDNLVDINLKEMIHFHEQLGVALTMAVTTVERTGDWGVIGLRGQKVVSFAQKPHKEGFSKLINTGIFIFEPKVFKLIRLEIPSMLETSVIPQLVSAGEVAGYNFDGMWFDIANSKIYAQALKYWKME